MAAAAAAPAAGAAPWGYEQVSPPDGASIDIFGLGASADANAGILATYGQPIEGHPSNGRTGPYMYVAPRGREPWGIGPVDVANLNQLVQYLQGISTDGSHVLHQAGDMWSLGTDWFTLRRFAEDGSHQDFNPPGMNISASEQWSTPDLETVAFRSAAAIRVGTGEGAPVLASVDNDGNPMTATALGGADSQGTEGLDGNALADDGSSVFFTASSALAGDADGTAEDIYRRVLTPGDEETILVSDVNGAADPDADTPAEYRWATADHGSVLWRTAEQLVAGDTDNQLDLYLRIGDATPILVSQGEEVDGSPTGNGAYAAEWSLSSEDGNRVYFASGERLTQDAPADGSNSLYERDVAAGTTRFVAGPLPSDEVLDHGHDGTLGPSGVDNLSFRGIRVTPSGVVFMSAAPLAGDADGEIDVFSWTRGGGLTLVSAPAAGAPASASQDATFVAVNLAGIMELKLLNGGRSVSADGSRVFFTTAQSLVAEDTDGGFPDVYAWTAGEGVTLLSPPGDAPHPATYLDSSADGTEVFFQTYESILPGDGDPNAVDVYRAILGGGAAPGKPAPKPTPAGPGGPAGPLPAVPSTSGPSSSAPKAPEPPAPVTETRLPEVGGGDRGDRGERAELEVKAARRVRGDGAVLRVTPSVAGELRIKAKARVARKGKRRVARVGSETEDVSAGAQRVSVELSRKALRRLERKGRLRVRFVARLSPSGDERPVKERITVTLRSGERR